MFQTKFWHIIEQLRDIEESQVEGVTELLSQKGETEILDFECIFHSCIKISNQSHRQRAGNLIEMLPSLRERFGQDSLWLIK